MSILLRSSYSLLACLIRIYLAGQSAGAHLGACALLIQAKKQIRSEETSEEPVELTWKASQMNAYFALSGGLVDIKWNFDVYSDLSRIRLAVA